MEKEVFSQQDFNFFITVLIIALLALVLTRKLLKVSFPYFFMGVLGVTVGTVVGSYIGRTVTTLPGIYGRWLPIVIEVFVAVAVFDLFVAQAKPAVRFLANFIQKDENSFSGRGIDVVVDTSALIDGRIEEIVQTGFIFGKLVVPRFVLLELQKVADSEDSLRRARGRRGLDVLSDLQKNRQVVLEIIDDYFSSRDKVDSKLITLAKKRHAKILTVDYNLSRVAQIQGVETLNINELSAALKPFLIPGEELAVKVIQKGKEKKQGVGYLDDGTMVVVEGGDKYVGEELNCEVVRIFQTVAGKMIFVQPKVGEPASSAGKG